MASEAQKLRVWIGGIWFTLGASPYLSTNDTMWEVNLTNHPTPLPIGAYTIVVEVLTSDSYLLSSIYTDALTITQVAPTPPSTPPTHPTPPVSDGPSQAFRPAGDGTYFLLLEIPQSIKIPDPSAIVQTPAPLDTATDKEKGASAGIPEVLGILLIAASLAVVVFLAVMRRKQQRG